MPSPGTIRRWLTWDAQKEEALGDEEQAAMLNRPYRASWELPG